MVRRARLTELEAYSVKTRRSEPVGARGKGTLLLERKSSGAIFGFYRERTASSDSRLPLGILARKPETGTDQRTLGDMRAEALRMAAEVGAAGGLAAYLECRAQQETAEAAERARRQRQAEDEARRGTFADLMRAYADDLERQGKISHRKVRQLFKLHVEDQHPTLIAHQAAEIRAEDVQLILAGVLNRQPRRRGIQNKAEVVASNGMRTTCDELRRYLKAAFNYAARAHLSPERLAEGGRLFAISSNPVALIPKISGTGHGNTDSLEPGELAELLRYLDTLQERHAAIARAFLYFGGQRLRQLAAVPWDGVSDDALVLLDPKGRKESAWEHLLPITARLTEVMRPLLVNRIGPGPFAIEPGGTVHPDTITKLFSTAGRELAQAGRVRFAFTWKHLRATCETLLAAQGVPLEIRAWILSHGRSGVQAKHYDRYAYLPEKRAALEQWGRYLDNLHAGKQVDNVVLLSRRRG